MTWRTARGLPRTGAVGRDMSSITAAAFRRFAANVVGVDPVGSKEKIALKEIESMEVFFRRIHMLTNLRELGVGGAKDSAMLLPEEDMLAISKASL